MKYSIAEQRMAENQVAFRHINQRIPDGFEKLLELAKEEHHESLVSPPKGFLLFACECSDTDCKRRVRMKMKTWVRIHKNPRKFTVYRGHNIEKIERVTESHRGYDVVTKYECPRQDVTKTWPISLNFA